MKEMMRVWKNERKKNAARSSSGSIVMVGNYEIPIT